jgi:prepilin-type N-terminal cleavage/methylation domain-containing protein
MNARNAHSISPRRPHPEGFTLIELMVVLGIIAVMVTITVVATMHFLAKPEIEQTKVHQRIIMAAVARFYEQVGRYPNEQADGLTNALYQELMNEDLSPDAAKAIADLPASAVEGEAINEKQFLDAFHVPMRYTENGSMFNKPVLISAGPDGLFGDESNLTDDEREKALEDNIYSDNERG